MTHTLWTPHVYTIRGGEYGADLQTQDSVELAAQYAQLTLRSPGSSSKTTTFTPEICVAP